MLGSSVLSSSDESERETRVMPFSGDAFVRLRLLLVVILRVGISVGEGLLVVSPVVPPVEDAVRVVPGVVVGPSDPESWLKVLPLTVIL